LVIAFIVIVVVVVLVVLVRGMSGGTAPSETSVGASGAPDVPEYDDEDADDPEEGDLIEAVAITTDGWAFVPVSSGVELVPPGEDEESWSANDERKGTSFRTAGQHAPVNPHTGKRMVHWKPGEPLGTGDLIAARVVRGAPDVDPWRLEALGRDYDYRSFGFETEDGARTALDLVSERIVRAPRDGSGEPIPVGAEDFAVARRKFDETEAALATDLDIDDIGGLRPDR
jgi:hypothetical protein